MINFNDFIIIYFACGAPFAVHFYLQNRKTLSPAKLRLNSFLTMTVWFPYAVRLLHENITGRILSYRLSAMDQASAESKLRIDEIEKEFSKILLNNETGISLFDFRETFERYVGLTVAAAEVNLHNEINNSEKELFRVSGHEFVEMGAKCLHRRNQNRLRLHQNLARTDFLRIIGDIYAKTRIADQIRKPVDNLIRILGDTEAQNLLSGIFDYSSQMKNHSIVKYLEKDVWRPREEKQLLTNPQPLNLQAIRTTTALPKRD